MMSLMRLQPYHRGYTHCNAKLLKPSEEVVADRYLLLALLRAQRLYLQAHAVDLSMEGIGSRR